MLNIPKIIIPTKEVVEARWNKFMPSPLTHKTKVKVSSDQNGVPKNFIRVTHGEKGNKITEISHMRNFTTLKGEKIGYKK